MASRALGGRRWRLVALPGLGYQLRYVAVVGLQALDFCAQHQYVGMVTALVGRL